MGSSTKNQKVRSDNRRMTGNVNIYICSEAVEKNEKNAEENVTQSTPTSASSTSLISEKSRQNVGPIDEHLVSPNRVRKKLTAKPPEKQHNNTVNKDNATKDLNSPVKKDTTKDSNSIDEKLIATTEFNKFTSYESKSNPTPEENILKNTKESFDHKINNDSTRYDRSNMVSCRCPQFDESDLWLQKALKRQNRDSTGIAPTYSVKKADQNEQRYTPSGSKISGKSEGLDKKCTCDRNEKLDSKGNGACEQLCTCCCIDVHKKENINGSKSEKIDKKQTSDIKKETSKSSHDKKESEAKLEKRDKKSTENKMESKVSNSKDNSKDTKENLKTKKSISSEKVKSIDKAIKVEKSNDSKKSSKERLPPVESDSNKKAIKYSENVKKAEKKSKPSIKEKANKEDSSPKEKAQKVQSQSNEKKKIKEKKESSKTKNKLPKNENSGNKSPEPRKSDDIDAKNSAKTKKKKEKKAKESFTATNELSHRKVINDRKEDSFFSKLINMMKSNKKVSSRDVKKRGCSPDCTGLTRATESSTKSKSNREKSGQKSKPSGTIISNGSHNIPNEFHDFKSASDTQVNDTNVDLNLRAKTENDEKSVPLLEKTDDATDKTFDRSKAEDKSEEIRYCEDRVGRYPEITEMNAEDNGEDYSRLLEKNCSCYDCLRDFKAACDQFSFSNSYPREAYFEKSIESCCACKPQKPVTSSFKEDRRRFFNDLQDYSLVMNNKLGRGTGSKHCCWCSCRDSA